MNQLPAQKVDGLIDGMRLLEELAAHKEPVAGLVLARKLGMSPVRVNRLLKTFAYLMRPDLRCMCLRWRAWHPPDCSGTPIRIWNL